MKQVLCLIFFFVSLSIVAQVQDSIPSAGLGGQSPGTGQVILGMYCTEPFVFTPNLSAINLYQRKPALHFQLDPQLVAVGHQAPPSYYNSLMTGNPGAQTRVNARPNGSSYGLPAPDIYNPYGVGSVPQAIVWGTVNYLLKRTHK